MPKLRKMISDWEAPYIQTLVKQIETQSKGTLANWGLDYCDRVLIPIWEEAYPEDRRPHGAILAAREWLAGKIKLPEAKKMILECHAAARDAEGTPAAQASARAIGQVASTIHSARHCVALPLYGSLAVAYHELGTDRSWNELEQCAAEECGRMLEALLLVSVAEEEHPAKINWKC